MAESTPKKVRSPNFSANDALLLCEIMAEESPIGGLSNHNYLRHRFTSCITSSSKKKIWMMIEKKFIMKSEHPRDAAALQKKWDNLVQVHRALYSDFLRDQQMTGGGPRINRLSTLTEAVIGVIGKKSSSLTGISSQEIGDSSFLQLNSLRTSSPADSLPVQEQSSSFSETNLPDDDTVCDDSYALTRKYSAVQVVCCQCNCHRQLEILKEEKLRLQIAVLKKQLEEE